MCKQKMFVSPQKIAHKGKRISCFVWVIDKNSLLRIQRSGSYPLDLGTEVFLTQFLQFRELPVFGGAVVVVLWWWWGEGAT